MLVVLVHPHICTSNQQWDMIQPISGERSRSSVQRPLVGAIRFTAD